MGNKSCGALGRLALFGATLIWGSSFVILKVALESIPPLWMLAFRFVGAALLMGLIGFRDLRKFDSKGVKYGALMGSALAVAYVLQTFGLAYTTPGKNAFLTATYCVIVPFLWWAFCKKRPDRYHVAAALVCITGMALVSLTGDLTPGIGDGLTMCCGFFFALHIVLTSRAVEGRSLVALNAVQFATAGVLCGISAPLVSDFPSGAPVSAWLSAVFLCVFCTVICLLLQTYGQKHTPPESAAIILTMESVFGTAFSLAVYHERLTFRVASGFLLIFVSILVSETKLSFLRKKKAAELSE